MIVVILSFIAAGMFLAGIIGAIGLKDKKRIILCSIGFILFLLFGILYFKSSTQKFPAAKYEISSKVTTRNVDIYEGGRHFSHIEKDTLYIVSRK